MHKSLERADIVIIGNGIAGLTAAIEARSLAPEARIAIITDQSHPTINTPALKQFAIGKLAQEQLLAYPAGTERIQSIRVINAHVECIVAEEKFLVLRGGYTFGYDSLLIATGSRPNGLSAHLPGRDFDGVLTLHCLQDYLDLRRRLESVDSAVVIGGGAHAVETVMSLLHHGIEVHWLIRSETILPHVLDHYASSMVLENTRNAGANILTKTEVIGVVGRVGSVVGVITNNNTMIPCQLVLVCTGTAPVTTLAKHCTTPMMYGRGIYVDEQFRTSVPGIYAAGDVAARKNPLTGDYETQAQWYAAVLQGRSAAATMTGHHELAAQAMGVPWHATHLGDLCMLTVGNPLHAFEGATICTDQGKKKYCRMTIIDDRLVGYLSIGSAQPDSLAIKSIIDEGLSIRPIAKFLLKGEFDARKYLTRRRSQEALDLVTSGTIPVVKPLHHPVTPVHSFPVMARPATSAVAQWRSIIHHSDVSYPVLSTMAGMETLHDELVRTPNYVLSTLADQLTIHGWEQETSPAPGKLPGRPERTGRPLHISRDIESILLSLPARAVARNLWSYSEKLPVVNVVKGNTSSSQHKEQGQSEKANFLL